MYRDIDVQESTLGYFKYESHLGSRCNLVMKTLLCMRVDRYKIAKRGFEEYYKN